MKIYYFKVDNNITSISYLIFNVLSVICMNEILHLIYNFLFLAFKKY
jgi:hypothetical protein